jgi:hypothetical protein
MSRKMAEPILAPIPIMLAVLLLAACATDAQHRAAEHAAVEEQTALEIGRICALPQPQRDAELARIKAESGIIVQCGKE